MGPEALRLKFQEILNILEQHDQLKPLFAAFDITRVNRLADVNEKPWDPSP